MSRASSRKRDRLQARAGRLRVRVGVEGHDLLADVVLDEGQVASAGGVVGVGDAADAEGPGDGLVIADDAGADELDELVGVGERVRGAWAWVVESVRAEASCMAAHGNGVRRGALRWRQPWPTAGAWPSVCPPQRDGSQGLVSGRGTAPNPEVWVALLTLTALEIVLGIDNIIFISILANKLPRRAARQGPARRHPGRDGHAHPAAAGHQLGRQPHRAALRGRSASSSAAATSSSSWAASSSSPRRPGRSTAAWRATTTSATPGGPTPSGASSSRSCCWTSSSASIRSSPRWAWPTTSSS